MIDFVMHPIGVIHSPFTVKDQTPIQASRSQVLGKVEVFSEYVPGLQDLDGFSHIILLYVWHEADGYNLLVKPFLDDQKHGIFATRYPGRPNQIGISIVRLLAVRDNLLEIEGVDVLDNTPLLDIKPYVPDFDIRTGTHSGWYEDSKELAFRQIPHQDSGRNSNGMQNDSHTPASRFVFGYLTPNWLAAFMLLENTILS